MEPETLKAGRRADKRARHKAYDGYIKRKWLVILVLVVLVVALFLVSLAAGSSGLFLEGVIKGLFFVGEGNESHIVWGLRMPRILTALVGGVALSLAGCVYQSSLRNPLASASTLGISQGAAFGASIAIIIVGTGGSAAYQGVQFASNPYVTVVFAFAGAMISTLAILGLSRFRDMTPEAIILAGVALSALFAGGTTIIQYFAEDSQVAAVVFWTFGDLGRVSYKELVIMGVITVLAAVYFFFNRWNYNAMDSGEASAHSLGVNVSRTRLISMFVASAAAASVIAFCGIINFVGLIAPHIMRRFLGSDYRYLLPASAIAGAGVLLLSDLVARMVLAPLILPISAITSFIGAPIFLFLLYRGVTR